MNLFGKYKSEDLLYSCIFGSGIYRVTKESVMDPLFGEGDEDRYSPILRNDITGEEFYMKLLNCSPEMYGKYSDRITNPPVRTHLLWPADMVDLQDKDIGCSLFVSTQYTDDPDSDNNWQCHRALLFPYGEYPHMINGAQRLKQIKNATWKNPEIRKIAYQLVKALDEINRSGYSYQDFHLSKFFFLDNDEIYLDFSSLAISLADCVSGDTETERMLEDNEYPLEFADPAVFNRKHDSFDFDSQNYSLTAFLFYLFIGIYPYDGRLLTGFMDDNIQRHYVKFRNYLKMPVFVFDPDDTHNALGAFAEDEEVIELWEELPDLLKSLFINTLKKSNAERETAVSNPTPGMWMACFDALGWNKEVADA